MASGLKVWHDDIRRPPDDTWMWVRTNARAKVVLIAGRGFIEELELDHDMGLDGLNPEAYMRMSAERAHELFLEHVSDDNGLVLARWMVENDAVPEKVNIHSFNPAGAAAMAAVFRDAGHACTVVPFAGRR